MRFWTLLPVILLIAAIAPHAAAHSAVIVVIDSLGSSYIYPEDTVSYIGGAPIPSTHLSFADRASAKYQLKVPVPATEYGHAVIVTGYSGAGQETVSYYHATLFDALKDEGYLSLGILENGDSREMLDELDLAVREKNDSISAPLFETIRNGQNLPPGLIRMMSDYPRLPSSKQGKDRFAAYIRYNSWALGFAKDTVTYMQKDQPGRDYILIVNAGALDTAGHNLGFDGYSTVLSGLDAPLNDLIDVCNRSDVLLMVTGDHGMSFSENSMKGSHASAKVAGRNESLMVPLLIYDNESLKSGGTYGQECVAPTLLALVDEPNTLSLCDGQPLPVNERPTLYVRSKSSKNVTLSGSGLHRSATINGIYRFGGLQQGNYTIIYDGMSKEVCLQHDELIDLPEDGDRPSPAGIPPLAGYVAAAALSAAGIIAALKLVWGRR